MQRSSGIAPRLERRPGQAGARHGLRNWVRIAALSSALCAALASTSKAQQQDRPFDAASAERFLAGVKPEDRPYLIHTGARWMLPRAEGRPAFQADQAVVYLQFVRPLAVEEQAELTRAGVQFQGAVHASTYLARIRSAHLRTLYAHPLFRGIEGLEVEDKLAAALYFDQPNPLLRLPGGHSRVIVTFHQHVKLEHALAVLDRWAVQVPERWNYGVLNRVQAIANRGQVLALAEEGAVRRIDEGPWPEADDNTVAAALSNIDDVQAPPWNLTGQGVRLGIWEVGGNPRVDHPDYVGRLTEIEADSDSDHATHVAGTMIGDGTNNALARGMAPAAELDAYTSGNSPAEQIGSYADGVRATNSSFGTIIGWTFNSNTNMWEFNNNQGLFGAYTSDSQDWDAIALNVPLMVQKSAGNDRNDCNPGDSTDCDGTLGADGQRYDTMEQRASAKNIITVGATDGVGALANFSNSGPTDDGRIKPDLVADGVNMTSTWAGSVTIGGCPGADYCTIGGTSMSTPTVTGAIALLVEKYRDEYFDLDPSPAAIKALLVNTAVDLGRPGPDYLFGHGLLDALAAVQTIDVGAVRIVEDSVGNAGTDVHLVAVPAGLPELRVSLAWVDPVGAADSADPDLINNLDLRLIAPDGSTVWPFTGPQGDPTGNATASGPNTRDNVEHARVPNPQVGYWTVRVRGAAVPLGPQPYALVANSAFYLGNQPNIDVAANLNFPETCIDDDFHKQVVRIFNTGGANLLVHDVTVVAGGADFSLLPFPSPPFVLPPGSHIDLYVVFDPSAAGLRTGSLQILSNDADEGVLLLPMTGVGGVQDMAAAIESKGYFGKVALGHQQSKLLQVLNQGTCPLLVQDVALGMGSPDFSVGAIEGFPAFPFTLFPGESALVFMNYLPSTFGFHTAVFQLSTNDPDRPLIPVTVRGECLPPDIALTGSLRFGEVCAGELAEKTLDVCNTGISDLVVTSVAFDPPCADFTIINNPYPNTVSHDFCLGVTVRYTPTGVGSHTCTLVIQSNDPDQPTVTVTATGTTPANALDVSPDLCFPPTVVQSLGNCWSELPFPVTNTGNCPVTITAFQIVQPLNEFTVTNLPALPITLLPGEQLGDGILRIVFRPELVQRYREAQVHVTWVTNDPAVGDTQTVTRDLVGEGVNTGLRMVVRQGGVPIPTVDRITLYRVLYPDTADEALSIVQIDVNQDLQFTLNRPPCPSVPFHQEYGGETNPIVLEPGVYLLWVDHDFGMGTQTRKERVVLDDWCDFEEDIAIDY